MKKKEVVITIPVYQTTLNSYEQIALKRCLAILGNYPIVLVCPESLYTDKLQKDYTIQQVVRFKDDYFKDIEGYNALMLSSEFYSRFLEYDYILIYQLDAYVFKDELHQWCTKGYDYIGAPWIPSVKYNHPLRRIELRFSQFIWKLFSIHKSRSNYFHTGNGGFSLRNTQHFYDITLTDKEEIKKFLSHQSYHYAEDIYWGVKVNQLKKRLNIPDYKEALSFAFENHPEMLYSSNNKQLPFGCHAWYKKDRLNFWESFIPELTNDKSI